MTPASCMQQDTGRLLFNELCLRPLIQDVIGNIPLNAADRSQYENNEVYTIGFR